MRSPSPRTRFSGPPVFVTGSLRRSPRSTPSQISVGVAVCDALRGDFDDVSTLDQKTGVVVVSVNDFKDCIISACGWKHVRRRDFTLVGPYANKPLALSSFATATAVDNKLSVASIQRESGESYVVARFAPDVNLETGA